MELADGPHGVEMTEEQDLRPATPACPERRRREFGEQVIAAVDARQACDTSANRLEPRGELATAAIDGGLVGRRRLEAHERFGGVDHPVALVPAEITQSV